MTGNLRNSNERTCLIEAAQGGSFSLILLNFWILEYMLISDDRPLLLTNDDGLSTKYVNLYNADHI